MNDSNKLFRIVNEGDQVHYFIAESKDDVMEEYCEYMDPVGFGIPHLAVSSITEVPWSKLYQDLEFQPELTTVWFGDDEWVQIEEGVWWHNLLWLLPAFAVAAPIFLGWPYNGETHGAYFWKLIIHLWEVM